MHKTPENVSKKLCKFLNIKYDKNMTKVKKWKLLLKHRFNFINESAYNKQSKVYGFSVKRINKWQDHLKDWEINLINYLCQKRLKKLGYEFSKIDKKLLKEGISILKKDPFLKKRYNEFVINNRGNSMSLNDPTNPKNWESRIYAGTKFMKSKEYPIYKKELAKINIDTKKIKQKKNYA